MLARELGDLEGLTVLDAGCGTGRWLRGMRGARAFGFDGERAMLDRAPRGCVVHAELGRAPFRPEAFDLVAAGFSLSYATDPGFVLSDLCELVRAGGRLAVADLASEAIAAGWKREHGIPSRVDELERSLRTPPAGWAIEYSAAEAFGEPERRMVDAARWARIEAVPAVRLTAWRRTERGQAAKSAPPSKQNRNES